MATQHKPTQQTIDLVRAALQDPNYTWRTISGIQGQTQISTEDIQAALRALGTEVVQSEIPDENGEDLFTTRSHYQSKMPWWRRVLAALKNRAD